MFTPTEFYHLPLALQSTSPHRSTLVAHEY